ncbi:MAG: hypothetical protein JWL68_5018, partial [Actinomycetia bacterium]|nr:hypothetical protein [Actinomycetes bacterium]
MTVSSSSGDPAGGVCLAMNLNPSR